MSISLVYTDLQLTLCSLLSDPSLAFVSLYLRHSLQAGMMNEVRGRTAYVCKFDTPTNRLAFCAGERLCGLEREENAFVKMFVRLSNWVSN